MVTVNPELYSAQFEDSACTLVQVSYNEDLENRVGKANISRVFSTICIHYPSISSAEDRISLYFSLKVTNKIGKEAWQEIQSFRCPFGRISLRSDFDGAKEILSSDETDDATNSMPEVDVVLISNQVNGPCDGHHVISKTENEEIGPNSTCTIILETLDIVNKARLEAFFIQILESVMQRKNLLERCLLTQNPGTGQSDVLKSVIPLTLEKEEKQLLGVNVPNMKERTSGRCLKLLGDIYLFLNKLKLAAENFKRAAECLMTAKDWTWYAAALEGSITSAYLMHLPVEHSAPSNFYGRLVSHHNEILCIEDRLPITDRMKQALTSEKAIVNYYDKSGETKALLYEFKYKVSLARYSFGIFKSKLEGPIIDDHFKLFPELRSKSSPKQQSVKRSASSTSSDAAASEVRKCLAAVKLFVFKEQTRKAAWLLREVIGGDISCGYFRQNPKVAIMYLIQILPVYEISIADAFRHRATRRGRLAWKELQQHLIDLILYYTELLQQNKFFCSIAGKLNVWFKCFMLNTFYHLLPGAETSNLINAISLSKFSLDGSKTLTLDCLTFPTISFTNIPFLRSIEIIYPYKRQLHLKEKSQPESLNSSSVFEYQTAFVGSVLMSKPYIWPASSSIIVQLMFSNSLKCEQNMSLNVELVLLGVDVGFDTRTVRIPSLSVESVNFEVTLIEPGEFTICGYKVQWIEMDYNSEVIFNENSKFLTKHSFGVPYLECYWLPQKKEEPGNQVTDEKIFITKDYILTKALFFGSTDCVEIYIDALNDIDDLQINLVSRSASMFTVDNEKRSLSKGQTLPVTFNLSSADVTLSLEDDLFQVTSTQSFVKVLIDGLMIPFFTLSMEVFPSVVVEEVTLLPSHKPQFFNIGVQLRNYMGVDIIIKAGDNTTFTIMANSVERNLFLEPKVTSQELKSLKKDNARASEYFDVMCLFQRFKITWFDEKNKITGSVYLSPVVAKSLEPKFVHDLCVDKFLKVSLSVQNGGEIEDKNLVVCTAGHVAQLLAEVHFDSELDINLTHETPLEIRTSTNLSFKSEQIEDPVELDEDYFRPHHNPIILGCNIRFPFTDSENCYEIEKLQEVIEILPVFPGTFYFQIVLGASLFSKVWKFNINTLAIE